MPKEIGAMQKTMLRQWLMLQQDSPKDYVIATGKTYSVKEFVKRAFEYANLNYKDYLEVSDKFFRAK